MEYIFYYQDYNGEVEEHELKSFSIKGINISHNDLNNTFWSIVRDHQCELREIVVLCPEHPELDNLIKELAHEYYTINWNMSCVEEYYGSMIWDLVQKCPDSSKEVFNWIIDEYYPI